MKYFSPFYILFFFCLIVFSCENKAQKNFEKTTKVNLQSESKQGALLEISAAKLLTMLKYDKNAFVIDVRKADKSIKSCKLIEGYKHLEDSLVYKNPSILPKGKSIVLLSEKGDRSRRLGEFLKEKGMTVYNLRGGMDSYWEWRAQIIKDSLHIYDEQINVIELYADDFGC
ncbi:MAG: rhodanese-like domain-containing protein [Lutibacter sp.]|nr:rhodanese-like domain-containing protein [Lutibacter sp.]